MTDIALVYDGTRFDIALGDDGDLLHDDGLETAVALSLFLDRRADDDDELPGFDGDRRGWWGDAFADVDGDRIGSKLWLLDRSKQTADVLNDARAFSEESLQWSIEDDVSVSTDTEAQIVREEMLGTRVAIQRPGDLAPQWQKTWEVQLGG